MSQDDAVAVVLNRIVAREILAGKCLPRDAWADALDNDTLARVDEVTLILKRDSTGDGHSIANALVLALGVLPRAMIIDADAPVPEGFEHQHFVEVGEPPHFRSVRGQMVFEVIPPVTFCE